MSMTLFDLVLFLVLLGFVWFGLWRGLIRTISGIATFVLSLMIASRLCEILALKVLFFLKNNFVLSRVLSFLFIFFIAQAIIFFIFRAINKAFDFSVLKIFNRLAGALFGLIEGGLILGFALYFSSKLPLGTAWTNFLETSIFAGPLIAFSNILLPLLPEAIKQARPLLVK
ncbi:hypothetical protein B6D52_00135 [Candidatus Parcubacteria bacterium 4484_255]|nr:MAG: hypothetical protein B6D52_00135 [Candidatus Parcubacteria bacterium 4484_255]